MTDNYQTVTLIGSDGKKFVYHGQVQIDPALPPKIVDITTSLPKPLPPGASWVDEVTGKDKSAVQQAAEKGFNG